MNRLPSRLVAGTWLVALCAACTTTVVRTETRNTRSAYGLRDHSDEIVVPLRVPDDAAQLCVELEVDAEAGRVITELVSPDDSTPWRQTVDRGRFAQTVGFPAGGGEWRCRLVFEGFSGSYSVALSAEAGPEIEWPEIEFAIESVEAQPAPAGAAGSLPGN